MLKKQKVVYLLNHPNDVPLAILLYKTCPEDVQLDVILTNISTYDEFGWGSKGRSPKFLEPCIQEKDIVDIKALYNPEQIFDCRGVSEFKQRVKKYDVAISRGREFVVLKELAKKSVALSMNRCYFNRLLDAIPYYNNLKVFLYGPAWLEENLCGRFQMDQHDYSSVEKCMSSFKTIDVLGYYYEHLQKLGKSKIKQELGLPHDKKIAFLSFRMAEPAYSVHRNVSEFLQKTEKMLLEFKERGYYILSRERLDKPNVAWDKRRGVYGKIDEYFNSGLIDIKMNGHAGYPSLVWRAMYASDILLLSDVSGICTNEGILCRTPVYMPYDKYFLDNKLEIYHNEKDPINPVQRDMIKKGFVFNEFNQKNVDFYKNNIEEFVKQWYNTDIKSFWKEVLEDNEN
tara:strand:- start:1796 stop:2992 length:1197 start_codon:yes stop_codon:yes gene_type:complete